MMTLICWVLSILSVQCCRQMVRKEFYAFLLLFIFCPLVVFAQRSDSVIVDFLKTEHHVNFSNNNSVVLFKNGQEKFDDLFLAVKEAKESIHMEYFNFRNDSISALLFDLLEAKVKEGVEVRCLFDGFGNSSNDQPLKKEHLEALRERGIEIYEFDKIKFPWLNHAFHRDHRKIVVIDGVVAYTGGMNVADYYIVGKPEFGDWRDLHTRVEGDIVSDLQGVFINFWNKITGEQLGGMQYYPGMRDASALFPDLKRDTTATAGKKLIGLTNRDPFASPYIVHDTFIKAINSARKQIKLINPYLSLCSHTKKALKAAARRGVDVQIMVSAKSDIPVTPRLVERNAHMLIKEGAKVYFYEGGFHHSKIMMVDGIYSYIGSANLNSRSMTFDYECNMLIADRPTTEALISIFDTDKRCSCFELTEERWKTIPFSKRFWGWFYNILTPLV